MVYFVLLCTTLHVYKIQKWCKKTSDFLMLTLIQTGLIISTMVNCLAINCKDVLCAFAVHVMLRRSYTALSTLKYSHWYFHWDCKIAWNFHKKKFPTAISGPARNHCYLFDQLREPIFMPPNLQCVFYMEMRLKSFWMFISSSPSKGLGIMRSYK